MSQLPRIVDGDGHIFEDYDGMWEFMPAQFQGERKIKKAIFPELDAVHTPAGFLPPAAFDFTVNADSWLQFAADLNIEAAVLYPTGGLASGRIANVQWARAATRAYNDWLHKTYLARSPIFRGMGLVPLQDPQAAAVELRRCVNELGMCGVMLPVAGFKGTLGDKDYWPLYEAANEVGCALAVHGGTYHGYGLDYMGTFASAHALGHPFGVATQFSAMTFNGIFDRFPKARFGFMEAGVGWLLMALERFDGSYKAFRPYDPDRELLQLRDGEDPSDHLIEVMRNGQVFIGVEGDEPGLAFAVKQVGHHPFVFSSDYPHEVNSAICRHEIEELLENPDLDAAAKEGILSGNGERLYGLAQRAVV